MSSTSQRALAAAALAIAILTTGCGSSDDEPASTTQAQTTTTAVAASAVSADLLGTYERRVTRADIERTDKLRAEAGPNQEKPAPGPVRLIIGAATLKFVDVAAKPPFTIEQRISATDKQISIEAYVRPDRGSFCGPEIPQNASYTWTREGDVLLLKATDDTCADRDSTLTGQWKLRTG